MKYTVWTILAAALACAACATTKAQGAGQPQYVCEDASLTGSNIERLTCRPPTDAERRAADQEAIRRAQQKNLPAPDTVSH